MIKTITNTKKKPPLHPSVKKIFSVIIAFFVIFFAGVIYTIYLAQKNFEPVMDKRYYEKGLNYEARKQEFQNAKERNWKTSINIFKSDSIPKNVNLEIYFFNTTSENLKKFFSDPKRKIAILKVSYPATLKKNYQFEFLEKDCQLEKDRIVLKKPIHIPSNGFFEFRLELRPEKDAAIFYTKKLYVE